MSASGPSTWDQYKPSCEHPKILAATWGAVTAMTPLSTLFAPDAVGVHTALAGVLSQAYCEGKIPKFDKNLGYSAISGYAGGLAGGMLGGMLRGP